MLVSLLVVLTIGNLFIVLDVSQSDVYVSAICLSISGDLFKCLATITEGGSVIMKLCVYYAVLVFVERADGLLCNDV